MDAIVDGIRQDAQTSKSTREIITEACGKAKGAVKAALPKISNMSRVIRRRKQKRNVAPATPRLLRDLIFDESYTVTTKNENFMLYDSGAADRRTVIFATDENIRFLKECKEWYMDGTFRVCPPLFNQIYTIHGTYCVMLEFYFMLFHSCFSFHAVTIMFKNRYVSSHLFTILGRRFEQYIPLVYVLSSHKDTASYTQILEKLKEKEPNLNPEHTTLDFEAAAISAISGEFPEAEIHGCFFHFSQSIWRNIQKLGLSTKYAADADFAWQLRQLTAIAFVPPEKVRDAFKTLKTKLKIKKRAAVGTIDYKMIQLFHYFETTWIGSPTVRAKFPIHLWNMCALTLSKSPRTNNAVEGWHNVMNSFVACKHPSIWTFIAKIKREQDLQEVKMVQMMNNGGAPKKRKYMDHDCAVYKIVKTYNDDASKYKMDEYLGTIANHLSY